MKYYEIVFSRSQRRQIWMSALVFWLRTRAATRLPSATFWRHCLAWRVKSFKLWLGSQGEKQEVSNCMLEQVFIRLVLRSILTFTTTTSWATTVFPWLHSGDAEAFAKVPDRGPSARIGRPGPVLFNEYLAAWRLEQKYHVKHSFPAKIGKNTNLNQFDLFGMNGQHVWQFNYFRETCRSCRSCSRPTHCKTWWAPLSWTLQWQTFARRQHSIADQLHVCLSFLTRLMAVWVWHGPKVWVVIKPETRSLGCSVACCMLHASTWLSGLARWRC